MIYIGETLGRAQMCGAWKPANGMSSNVTQGKGRWVNTGGSMCMILGQKQKGKYRPGPKGVCGQQVVKRVWGMCGGVYSHNNQREERFVLVEMRVGRRGRSKIFESSRRRPSLHQSVP